MDDNDSMEVNRTGLDLNRVPSNQPLHRVARYGSLLNELETAHDQIEQRIRQLEAVTARARQRQRWRQQQQPRNSIEIAHSADGMAAAGSTTPERGKGCKRDSSHLVAKALEIDTAIEKPGKERGSFYDCNICLDLAREPVLTCCGHMFCWSCFYQVLIVGSSSHSKQCSVCNGEVSDTTITPVYGGGDGGSIHGTELGLQIPPRPKAHRVESVRQQRFAQGLSDVPVSEALRRIRISIGAMGDHPMRIHQVSRVLSESAASLSSLSSALSNAERLVEDLESVINNRVLTGEMGASVANLAAGDQTGDVGPPAAVLLPSLPPPVAGRRRRRRLN